MLKRTILLGVLLALAGAAGAVKEVKTIIHTDHLGSPIMGRSMDGETLWERHYEPYGSQDQAPDDPASPGYTGHLEERDSGLVYAGARWYDPRIGRFMSPDPVGFSVSNPVSFNRYAYANNNPIAYTDPDGRLGVIAAAMIGGGVFLISENANTPDVGEKTYRLSADGLAPGALLIVGGVIVEVGVGAAGTAAVGTGARLVTKRTVDDLIRGSKPSRGTKGRTRQFDRSGGLDQANKDFDALSPSGVRDIPGGRVGKLDDGRTVIVRSKSSDGRPTLEIQQSKNKIKFRFDD